jgi:hypothetical protein
MNQFGNLDAFWAGYRLTLERVRVERPVTLDHLATILNAFQAPQAGRAFFGNNADDQLGDAVADAGWVVHYVEGDYVWEAGHPASGEWIHYIEGDVYEGRHPSTRPF